MPALRSLGISVDSLWVLLPNQQGSPWFSLEMSRQPAGPPCSLPTFPLVFAMPWLGSFTIKASLPPLSPPLLLLFLSLSSSFLSPLPSSHPSVSVLPSLPFHFSPPSCVSSFPPSFLPFPCLSSFLSLNIPHVSAPVCCVPDLMYFPSPLE